MKEKKDIALMDFEEYYRKSHVRENSKVYWNERYCYISKSRWSVQYLENFASDLLLVEIWRWNWMTFAEPALQSLYVYCIPAFLRGQDSTPCHKRLWSFFVIKFRLSILYYHFYIQHVAKKYYIISILCLQSTEPFLSKHFSLH